MSPSSLLLSVIPAAQAFCGTYVGGAGAELYNNVAEVAVVRQGTRTTLTMSNDVEGDTEDFAMVLPVPEVLPEDAVNVVDWGIFERLDAYSAPRLVEYECDDFVEERWSGTTTTGTGGTSGGSYGWGEDLVDVEAEYVVGEYQVVILSAEQSGALFTWLNDNGYVVPQASRPLLQEYIDAGSYFLAAQVRPESGVESGFRLSPLQLRYDSETFSVPIRLGTLNAKDSQDLILYVINNYWDGEAGISNYAEATIPDECMWESGGESFAEFYSGRFARTYAQADAAVWVNEYSWGAGGCDPCTGTPPDGQDIVTLGYDQALASGYRSVWDMHLTRLHMRYAPQQATADVTLYHSGRTAQSQQRYIRHLTELEDRFPVCDEGMRADPGTCWGDSGLDADAKGCGCGSKAAVPVGVGALLILGAGVLRRREED